MTVNIQAQFKKDSRVYNGLDAIAETLIDKPTLRHIVVGVVETTRITTDVADGGTETPTVNFVQIEALDGDDAATARGILERRYAQRTNGSMQDDLFSHADENDSEE